MPSASGPPAAMLNPSHGHLTPAPAGQVLVRALSDDPGQWYFLYLPRRCPVDAPVVVSVHGITRNACEHAMLLAPFAERYRVVLVAPLFAHNRYRRYQRLRNERRHGRPERALEQIVAEVRGLIGATNNKILLFGYSGGGQFAHRYAMAYPAKVAGLAVGAAGWYTFPDSQLDYPLGTRRASRLLGIDLRPDRFSTVPACVLVGESDTECDAKLNKLPKINAQQGYMRLERGRRWVEAMSITARAYGYKTAYQFQTLADCDHSFVRSIRRGCMATRLFEFLLTASGERQSGRLGRMTY